MNLSFSTRIILIAHIELKRRTGRETPLEGFQTTFFLRKIARSLPVIYVQVRFKKQIGWNKQKPIILCDKIHAKNKIKIPETTFLLV